MYVCVCACVCVCVYVCVISLNVFYCILLYCILFYVILLYFIFFFFFSSQETDHITEAVVAQITFELLNKLLFFLVQFGIELLVLLWQKEEPHV